MTIKKVLTHLTHSETDYEVGIAVRYYFVVPALVTS